MVKTINVPLSEPVGEGDKKIDSVTLRKPMPGELRGLNLTQIISMDVDAMFVLLPRITKPVLDANLLGQIDPYDFGELAARASGFFTTPPGKG